MRTPFPNADAIEFKPAFIERYAALTDFEEFKKTVLSFPRRSVRINTLKISLKDGKERLKEEGWKLTQIPWCPEGFWVEHKDGRRDIGNTRAYKLGYIYVQEAASMIPPLVLEPQPGEKVLDMCASPGSKASQIASMMKNEGLLVANDFKGDRMSPLGMNLQRSGVMNAIITLMQGQWFKNIEFDRILVDAPCSGTGTIAKSPSTLRIWNPNMIRRLSGTQKQLISAAFETLRKGGALVYSTCSSEPEENEEVIDFLLQRFNNSRIEEIELKGLKRSDCILRFQEKSYNSEICKCLRIWPQDNDTEGFFVAKIRKD